MSELIRRGSGGRPVPGAPAGGHRYRGRWPNVGDEQEPFPSATPHQARSSVVHGQQYTTVYRSGLFASSCFSDPPASAMPIRLR